MGTNFKHLLTIFNIVYLSVTPLSAATYKNVRDEKMVDSSVPPAKYVGESAPICYISADYTYWTARENGLYLGSSNTYDKGPVANPVQGTVYYPAWYTNSGFKVGFGTFLKHDGWDLEAEYTWFSNQNNPIITSTVSAASLGLPASSGSLVTSFTTIGSQWSNYFNRVDLDMGRAYWIGHYLTMRPFAGLMGAWENQTLVLQMAPLIGDTNQVTTTKQKWWGIGPYTGIDTLFSLPRVSDSNEFGIFLNSGFAMPWSQYKVTTIGQTTDPGQPYNYSSLNTYYKSTPMLEMSLGLVWESWWRDHSFCFALSAAWENQLYFAHNQMFSQSNAFSQGGNNMILQGLTVKAFFAF